METESRKWKLDPETEYRFELDPSSSIVIKLLDGTAEVFGAELGEGRSYLFGSECKGAVYTWRGFFSRGWDEQRVFTITEYVTGRPSTEYVSGESPMNTYANLHIAFEQMRVKALGAMHGSPIEQGDGTNTDPPRILVLGPENSGKSTICKIIANYAVRAGQGWAPMMVNVDTSQGGWTIPGTVSAATISSPIWTGTPASSLGSTATTAPASTSSNALLPLVYFYGHSSVHRNPLLLDRLIRNLGENIWEKCEGDAEAYASGIIVDTPPSFAASTAANTEHRQRLIKACVDAFKINVVLVVGQEKLFVELQRSYAPHVTVAKIPKSGGVVELDHAYRERLIQYQIHSYMYGHNIQPPPGVTGVVLAGETTSDLILSPSSTTIGFSELTIYRIGGESMAPSSALPIGSTRIVSEMQPVQVDPTQSGSGLLNAVLAILAPPNSDEGERYDEEILDLPVMGFLAVTAIDSRAKRMTILSPNQGSFSGHMALVGSCEMQEQV